MQQGVQTDATCNIQQCWELLANKGASIYTGIYCLFREAQQLKKKTLQKKKTSTWEKQHAFCVRCPFWRDLIRSTFDVRTEKLVCKAPCKRTRYCRPTTPNIVPSVWIPCWMLFRVVAQSLKPVKLLGQQLSTFFCSVNRRSVAQQCWIRLHSSLTALPTLLGPRMRITNGLKRLMGCILPTLHCRSQHCWELLHPFAHHC